MFPRVSLVFSSFLYIYLPLIIPLDILIWEERPKTPLKMVKPRPMHTAPGLAVTTQLSFVSYMNRRKFMATRQVPDENPRSGTLLLML
jgi:hypothetical protein